MSEKSLFDYAAQWAKNRTPSGLSSAYLDEEYEEREEAGEINDEGLATANDEDEDDA